MVFAFFAGNCIAPITAEGMEYEDSTQYYEGEYATGTDCEELILSDENIDLETVPSGMVRTEDAYWTTSFGGQVRYNTYYNASGEINLGDVLGITQADMLRAIDNNFDTYLNITYKPGFVNSANLKEYNCTGYVNRVMLDAGANVRGDLASAMWISYLRNNRISYRTYVATEGGKYDKTTALVDAICNDGYAEPGDIVWFWNTTAAGANMSQIYNGGLPGWSAPDHHIGVFTGNYLGDKYSSTGKNWVYGSYYNNSWIHCIGEFCYVSELAPATPNGYCATIIKMKDTNNTYQFCAQAKINGVSMNENALAQNGYKSVRGAVYTIFKMDDLVRGMTSRSNPTIDAYLSSALKNGMSKGGKIIYTGEELINTGKVTYKQSATVNGIDSNGNAYCTFSNLTPGNYFIVQTKAPDGYKPDTEIKKVLVKANSRTLSTSKQSTDKMGYSEADGDNYIMPVGDVDVSGLAHIQDYGDIYGVRKVENGYNTYVLGTRGESKRIEEIKLNLINNTEYSGDIEYMVHIQNVGWTGWIKSGQSAGSRGRSLRLEGIRIRLTGELAEHYTVRYCSHIQNYGDAQGWVYDGALSGTTGESKRLEEIKVQIIPKEDLPSTPGVTYRTHIQDYGWETAWRSNGAITGTQGKSKRLEGITIALTNSIYSGGITYETHVQNLGWIGSVSDGEMSGTQGRAYRLEAIKVSLYGEVAEYFDIYYRVHAQNFGWLGWARNGEPSGTSGYSYRLEAMQIIILPKNSPVPANDYGGVISNTDTAYISR